MHCFQITERVIVGLPLTRDCNDHPRLQQPQTCPFRLELLPAVTTYLVEHNEATQVPFDSWRLGVTATGESVDMWVAKGEDSILFRTPNRRPEAKALIWLCTSSGAGGHIALTANTYSPQLTKRNEVERVHHPFPDAGVFPLCTNDYLDEVQIGVESLDLLMILHKGASFRIVRDGQLEGASPQMFVHWTGRELRITRPKRYEDREAAGFLEVAGAAAAT